MRECKSYLEMLSDCRKQICGRGLDVKRIEKELARERYEKSLIERGKPIPEPEIKLNLKASTNTDVKGYVAMKACGITMATLPIDYVHPENRLDAPCDVCVNRQCPYSQGTIPKKKAAKMSGKKRVSKFVTVFTQKLNADMYGDFVKCADCGKTMLIGIGDEECGLCGSENLIWANLSNQEASPFELETLGYAISYAE